ncbi:MAG: hypothetical protein HY225_01640 [Candidatus Vogelbacteria bacterium]|nr:hypothetical protein [Candidatus Vogelbacteria bacterium]
MNNKNSFPVKGDVITSSKFAYGYLTSENREEITVDGKTTGYPMRYRLSEEDRLAITAKTGRIPPKERTIELGRFDKNRGSAKFVVEDARMDGGDTNPRDPWPDGWHITARRLSSEGTYDPSEEIIDFYMSGCFNCIVLAEDIKILGKMKMVFI